MEWRMNETEFQSTVVRPPTPKKGGMWLLGAVALGVVAVATLPTETNIPWLDDLAVGHAVAYEKKLPVLLNFTGEGCVFCIRMDREVFTEPAVEEAIKGFVPVRIDWSKEPELAMRYGVNGIPAFLVLGVDGRPVLASSGFQPPEMFTAFLTESVSRLRASSVDP